MRLEWVGTMGPRLVTETLARCGWALTGRLALNDAGLEAPGGGTNMTRRTREGGSGRPGGGPTSEKPGSETRAEACWTAPPRGVVVVTAQASEAWSELLAVDPTAFRERLGPGVTDPPDGIVVDLTSSPREVARALRPLGDLFARVATVAIVRDEVGAPLAPPPRSAAPSAGARPSTARWRTPTAASNKSTRSCSRIRRTPERARR